MKEELGLDHFEGHSWQGLHRHALMAMIAYAFLQHRRLGQTEWEKKEAPLDRLSPACRPYDAPSSPRLRQSRRQNDVRTVASGYDGANAETAKVPFDLTVPDRGANGVSDRESRLMGNVHIDRIERLGLRLFTKPTFAGLLAAFVFWWPALTPTLIPRTWTTQALIGAATLAIAYGIGALSGYWIRLLSLRLGRLAGPVLQHSVWILLGIGWLTAIVYGPVLWMDWQNDQRNLMGMQTVDRFAAALMA